MNLGEWANKAMDPRDRIFAVLSFASDSNELRILPAYTTSCAHVYLQAATEILSRSLTLDIFYAVSSSKNVQGLPSWVPDWSSPNASTFGPRRIGKACAAGILSVARPQFSFDIYGNKLLSLSSHTVDAIHAILQKQ
ncbi:hypothetical protein J3458_021210 [Metarhizium acridum]|uniref:uncharacterized protein n=1 Tax=Metarhizium acridum TaxID=92637 RepID=UPI001C6BE8B3|nr:hypothetical protein J3458_021210 [Metarhizium acridum]